MIHILLQISYIIILLVVIYLLIRKIAQLSHKEQFALANPELNANFGQTATADPNISADDPNDPNDPINPNTPADQNDPPDLSEIMDQSATVEQSASGYPYATGSTPSFIMNKQAVIAGDSIIQLYLELLQRQPTSSELTDSNRQMQAGLININGIRRKIIDSDEYQRNIKLQSNELNPELKKVLSDSELINYISNIYNEEAGKSIPSKMELPLRDIYIYLDYNDFAFRAMLRDLKYGTFEQDVLATEKINKTTLIEIFLKYFTVDDLINRGVEIYGANPSDKIPFSINNDNANPNSLIISAKSYPKLFDKDAAATALGNTPATFLSDHSQYSLSQTSTYADQPSDIIQGNDNQQRISVHKNDMVLIPEFAWSVPQERPPVCTTLGQKQLVQPVFTNSSLLLGTPIGEAAEDSQVGSIMPKFEYKEYVNIPK
jgi:hypothetical protein